MSGALETWDASTGLWLRRGRTTKTGIVLPPEPPAEATRFGFWAGTVSPGAGGTNRANYDRVNALMGPAEVYRMFHSGLPPVSFVGSDADFGPPVVVSFKLPDVSGSPGTPDINGFLAGNYDTRYTNYFNSIPSNREVWWCFWHEPEDDMELRNGVPPKFNTAQYKEMWAKMISLAPKRANLHPTVILMNFSLFKASRIIDHYIPPTGVECLFWDAYLSSNTKNIDGVVTKAKNVSASYGLDYGITELSVAPSFTFTGLTHEQTYTKFLRDLIPAARAAKSKMVLWFDSFKYESPNQQEPVDWRLAPHTEALALWNGR